MAVQDSQEKSVEIVIVGIGETAEMAYEYFTGDSPYKAAAFAAEKNYIENCNKVDAKMFGLPIVAIEDLPQKFPPKNCKAFVAMASGRLNHDRAHNNWQQPHWVPKTHGL